MSRGKVAEPSWEHGSDPSDDGSGTVVSARAAGDTSLVRLDLSWSVLGVERIGFGSAAWLAIGPGAADLAMIGEKVGAAQALRIGETGQVPEIELENLGGMPVLVPAHLVLTGGWQTRAVERSAVVPARASARIPVKCVEAGRWAPRDDRTAKTFEVAQRAGLRTRWSTAQNMSEQLSRHGRFTAEQSAVWQHVEQELSRTPEASHTRSYEAYLDGAKRQQVEAARLARVQAPAGANAVLLFPREGGFWLEAYPTPAAFAAQVDDLVADLFDPVTREVPAAADVPAVEALMRQIWAVGLRSVERIAGSIGSPYALVEPAPEAPWTPVSRVTGAALLVEGALAHLSLGSPPGRVEPSAAVSPARASQRGGASQEGALRSVQEGGPRPPSESAQGRASESAQGRASESAQGRASESAQGRVSPDKSPAPDAPRPAGEPAPRVLPHAHGDTTRGSMTGLSSKVLLKSPDLLDEGGNNDQPKVSVETMHEVYAKARDILPDEPPVREAIHGYRLLRALDGNVSWVDIRVGGDGYAVLGSHDRCDLVLAGDATIWLRHLIATCVRLDDGTVALRLIDLKTDVPFFLDDDTPQWSITANGPFAVRIGRHVVCGFPIGAGAGADEGARDPSAAPDPATRARLTMESVPLASLRGEGRSFRTAMYDPFTVVPSAPVSQIQELVNPSSSPNHVRVTLERGGMGASVEIPVEALDAGVLLGRALNCFDGGLRRIFCDAVSRAHVLLLRDHDDVYAFDLCTTNGTRVAGRRIRRFKLSPDGAALELGKKVTFRWHRRRASGPPPEPVRRGGSFILADAPPGAPPIDPKKLN